MDMNDVVQILIIGANLGLLVVVVLLTIDRAQVGWSKVAFAARQAQQFNRTIDETIGAIENATKESGIEAQRLREQIQLAEEVHVRTVTRHQKEELHFAYKVAVPDTYDQNGPVWEFVISNPQEADRAPDAQHPAAAWDDGRIYLVQAATEAAARQMLVKRLPEESGFRITLIQRIDGHQAAA